MKRIGIVLTSLGEGGAERSGAVLSQLLVNIGYDVTIIITQDEVVYEYSGTLYSIKKRTVHSSRFVRLFRTFLVFKRLISSGGFDCIIDGRHRATWLKQRFITSFIYRKLPVVYVVHSYNLVDYLPRKKWMARNIYKNAAIVGVSEGICKEITHQYGFNNVTKIANTIYNTPLQLLASNDKSLPDYPFVLYYGRLQENEKNLSFLIQAYVASELPQKNIKLLLLGNGRDEEYYKSLVQELKAVKDVIFAGYKSNPFPYVKNALFTTLTSNYEGFPMVLIESLMLKTPVVSVNCKSGPEEIIETGVNGILTPQNDHQAFVSAIDKMISDTSFYNICKNNTTKSVSHLSPEIIAEQWKTLLEKLTK